MSNSASDKNDKKIRLTMKDIAGLAGVSTATVSRVIHSPHVVSSRTRTLVNRIIRKHNYIYHTTAADLSRRKSMLIGLLLPTTQSPVFNNSVFAIQEIAQARGYSVLLGNTKYDPEIEDKLLLQFQERQLAGVILTGFSIGHESAILQLIDQGIPCVVILEKLDDAHISYVGFDNFRAAYTMMEYLLKLGHRRIGLIIGPFSKVGRVEKRLKAYHKAIDDWGLTIDPDLIIEREPTPEQGMEAMDSLLRLKHPPTAVFAASDNLAIGAMAAVHKQGLRIPENISIAGFDNIGGAAYCNPPLTTLHITSNDIGRLAIEALLDMIENDPHRIFQYSLDTEIIIRESCGPPPVA
jgi:DNA-binding LacI/PurR family transcriptional regulator